jgi:general secretion pathway protein J
MTRRRPSHRRASHGFTLVELLVAVAVLAMISTLIYGAFSGMKRSKEGVQRISDRYREARLALSRISRDLQSAYLSKHAPFDQSLAAQTTAFIGSRGNPADRVDFNSFSNQRLDRDRHQSDQAEISYFGARDPDRDGVIDLVRRISTRLDLEPDKGGRVEVLATDIDLFDLQYLDPTTEQWLETWDTRQAVGQPDRLPLQVRVILVLNGGRRKASDRGQDTIELVTKISIPIQNPLTFAIQ